MARIVNGIDQLFGAAAGGGLPPFAYSLGLWARSDLAGVQQMILGITNGAPPTAGLYFEQLATNRVRMTERNDPNVAIVDSDPAEQMFTGTWHHLMISSASDSLRTFYFDGAPHADVTMVPLPLPATATGLGGNGANPAAEPFRGAIAHLAVWFGALDNQDAMALAMGVSPLRLKRELLVAYIPIQRATGQEWDVFNLNPTPEVNGPIPYDGEPRPAGGPMWGGTFVAIG